MSEQNGQEKEGKGFIQHPVTQKTIPPIVWLLVGAGIVLITIFFLTGCGGLDNPFVKDVETLIEHYHDGVLHAHEGGDAAHTHSGTDTVMSAEPADNSNGIVNGTTDVGE